MSNIPSAHSMMLSKSGEDYTHFEEIEDMMIEFAKLHVQAALQAAIDNAAIDYGICMGQKTGDDSIDSQSIRDAYPLELIR